MIWKLPFSKEYRKRLSFMILLGLCASIFEGSQIGYIYILYLFPLSLIAVYFGLIAGIYLNKRIDKKAKV